MKIWDRINKHIVPLNCLRHKTLSSSGGMKTTSISTYIECQLASDIYNTSIKKVNRAIGFFDILCSASAKLIAIKIIRTTRRFMIVVMSHNISLICLTLMLEIKTFLREIMTFSIFSLFQSPK